jgi:hypothetical protein
MVVIAVTPPIPTRVLTVIAAPNTKYIEVSAKVPSGSQIFEDEKEVLASITSVGWYT